MKDLNKIYFNMQAKVYFERGGLPKYLPIIKNYGKKILIVTGRKFVFETGIIDQIKCLLSENNLDYILYPEVPPEPEIYDVEKGVKICKKENCDCVLGLGGGSAMDVAKVISVLATNPGKVEDYFGEVEYKYMPLPIITIPTTCGTGSEITRYAVLLDKVARTKKTVISENIIPKLSILDSDILKSLPYHLVVATGMDAFSHSAESFLSKKADALSQIFSQESIKMLWKYLPLLNKDSTNIKIREKIFLASLLAGFAINKTGTIIVHGMGYSLTVTRKTHHGTANALILPYVFEYLKENSYYEELTTLEKIWGKTEDLKSFIKTLGLPTQLRELGVTQEDIDELTKLSLLGSQRAVKNMKVPLGKNEFEKILLKAL